MSSPSSFTLFLAGAEIPGWKKLLEEQDSPMAVSYWALFHRGRLPKTKPYLLADRFAGNYPLMLESGGHSANSTTKPEQQDPGHLKEYAKRYEDFVAENIDRVTLVTEFDPKVLGQEWIEERRTAFYDDLPPKKFVAVWHDEWGMAALQEMATKYDVLGVSSTVQKNGRNIGTTLNSLVRTGIRLHGIGMTKPEELRAVRFSSASSTSWVSPAKYGDTILWDGKELHRYPMAYKERSRKDNRTKILNAGFDADKILADDTTEVLRLSIWSWRQQAEALLARRTNSSRPALDPFALPGEDLITDIDEEQPAGTDVATRSGESVTQVPDTRKVGPVMQPLRREEKHSLPVLDIEEVMTEETSPEGVQVISKTRLMRHRSGTMRVCDNCYVADRCPKFVPSHECAYDIPMEVATKEQRTAAMDGMIAMQGQRVQFMRFGEELNGGQADPNLSIELDRFFKLLAKKAEIEDDRDYFKATVEGRARSSTFGRLFGEPEPQREMKTVQVLDPIAMIEASLRGGD